MTSGLECDVEKVFEQFCELTNEEMNKAVKSALKSGAVELKKQTQQNLTSSLKKRDNHPGKYNDRIEDAVRISKFDNDNFDEDLYIKVHIMGTRAKYSGTYRARFLEKGTKDRYAKRYNRKELQIPRYLGHIDGKWFFKNAQGQVFPHIQQIFMDSIDKAVNKINDAKI